MNDHLQRLTRRLIDEGPAAVHADLIQLAARSEASVPGAAAALTDAAAPEVVRLRAFSVVARHLDGVRQADRVA